MVPYLKDGVFYETYPFLINQRAIDMYDCGFTQIVNLLLVMKILWIYSLQTDLPWCRDVTLLLVSVIMRLRWYNTGA